MLLSSLTYVVSPGNYNMTFALMAFPTTANAVAHLTGLGLIVETKGEKTFVNKGTINGETVPLWKALDESKALREALFDKGYYASGEITCDHLDLVERPIGKPAGTFGY